MRYPEVKCGDTPRKDDLRGGCTEGGPNSCLALFVKAPRSPDADLARKTLRALCERDRAAAVPASPDASRNPVCSCGTYGIVLVDSNPSTEREALVLLDDACVHGFADACDATALEAEFCLWQHTPGCDDLAEQGRLRTPSTDSWMRPAAFPPALRGCFVVASIDPCEGDACRGVGAIGAYQTFLPAAVGTTLCFDEERVSTRALGGRWDQTTATWQAYAGLGVYRPCPSDWPECSYERGSRLQLDAAGARYGRAHLTRAPEATTREARALPHRTKFPTCGHPR
jgi:hypothetical protein